MNKIEIKTRNSIYGNIVIEQYQCPQCKNYHFETDNNPFCDDICEGRFKKIRNHREREDDLFKNKVLDQQMSSAIYLYFKLKKYYKWFKSYEKVLGYNFLDLKNRLTSTLPEGYIWKDYLNGKKLHIDHIIPRKEFYYEHLEDFQFRQCWGLNNLRLLSIKENTQKNSKLIKSFQTSLRV